MSLNYTFGVWREYFETIERDYSDKGHCLNTDSLIENLKDNLTRMLCVYDFEVEYAGYDPARDATLARVAKAMDDTTDTDSFPYHIIHLKEALNVFRSTLKDAESYKGNDSALLFRFIIPHFIAAIIEDLKFITSHG